MALGLPSVAHVPCRARAAGLRVVRRALCASVRMVLVLGGLWWAAGVSQTQGTALTEGTVSRLQVRCLNATSPRNVLTSECLHWGVCFGSLGPIAHCAPLSLSLSAPGYCSCATPLRPHPLFLHPPTCRLTLPSPCTCLDLSYGEGVHRRPRHGKPLVCACLGHHFQLAGW